MLNYNFYFIKYANDIDIEEIKEPIALIISESINVPIQPNFGSHFPKIKNKIA